MKKRLDIYFVTDGAKKQNWRWTKAPKIHFMPDGIRLSFPGQPKAKPSGQISLRW
jgi:hypothetical protein